MRHITAVALSRLTKSVLIGILATPLAGYAIVLSTDFQDYQAADTDDLTYGLVTTFPSTGDIGGFYKLKSGQQWVGQNPDATKGNTSSQVLGGGDQTVNSNAGDFYFPDYEYLDGMTVKFDFYNSRDGTNENDSVRVSMLNIDEDPEPSFEIRNDREGSIFIGGVKQTAVTNFGANTWQSFTFSFARGSGGLYDMAWELQNLDAVETSVSGTVLDLDLDEDFNAGFTNGLRVDFFDQNDGTNHKAYADNLLVTVVPEPSAAALLIGVASLGLVFRRRSVRRA
ncbi:MULTISPECIES: PEP-CTERM sorting domain-containing protein [unclassified Lentimonas]|uniref:PEP-CTERM sorting domain-containing protein n=1 Tax=unclassified Lentimonas TaxID=2630993 RepID=UPI001323212E|nr:MULTISPECIES: PEP-CTERM sorting domain-containing protein [unclassified Lentimonas]CAA6678401.1 Unannotated [Lentimonas sp. CC4]CAA6685493.1 Unannotated [Lentimonas sp. CC6]CAA7076941.1 Unannotated [Lentimonas sp. CC4]CAA7170492.1 Unannotated [Lentimonas sp. CC21]CAA7179812.1 Unannotated [Lentimonas sp. CC8]